MQNAVVINKKWFKDQLEEREISLRSLARQMNMDPSALSRMLSGQRKMQIEEAREIAHFLRLPVSEVLRHAGVSVDLGGGAARVTFAAVISGNGGIDRLPSPKPLPEAVVSRAEAAISRHPAAQIVAAQVRAMDGPLAMWDDAVVLFAVTDRVEPEAIGVLSVCRMMNGDQEMVRVLRSRKTGEATVQSADGETREVTLDTASPVIAVIP